MAQVEWKETCPDTRAMSDDINRSSATGLFKNGFDKVKLPKL